MIGLPLSTAAAVLKASFTGSDGNFVGVSTDTRTLAAGQLFFALRGPNFDAHDKLAEAAAAGAAAAVVSHRVPLSLPQIETPDVRAALGILARHWRRQFNLPVLAITGSAGKTTVKEMLAAIMRMQGEVVATRGNLNNDIGVPLTLFGLASNTTSAVIEMGANHAGDIALLAAIAAPQVGIVTLCAPAHLAGFGSIEGVARTKGELFSGLAADGVAVINADDPFAPLWREMAGPRRVITFGDEAMVRARAVRVVDGRTEFILEMQTAGEIAITLAHRGLHNVRNALAAAAAASALAVSPLDIKRGLERAATVSGRLQFRSGPHGSQIIDDTYNANPASLAAALAVLAEEQGHRWLVLGDMGELGPDAAHYHRAAGLAAQRAGVERMFCIGELAHTALESFAGIGQHCADHASLLAALASALDASSGAPPTVLIKGSRMMTLDVIAKALTEGSALAC